MSSDFFCDLDALTAQQRERHRYLGQELRPRVTDFRELPNGYAIALRSSADLGPDIEEFLQLEQLCCPFFDLKAERDNGGDTDPGYVVSITGDGDIKPFIRAEFGIPEHGDASRSTA